MVHGHLDPSYIIPYSKDKGIIILDAFCSSEQEEEKGRTVKRIKIIRDFRYSSPEVIQSSKYLKIENDYWSIGMILLEMCLGNIPFNVNEYYMITKEEIEKLFETKDYSQELLEIIINLLINRKIVMRKEKKVVVQTRKNKLRSEVFQCYSFMKKRISRFILISIF